MNDKDLIEALRREGKLSGKNTPINLAAVRLAELTQPQLIETAPKDGQRLIGLAWDGDGYLNQTIMECRIGVWTDPNDWSDIKFTPTHWLPCVKVDPASLGGQVDEE